MANLVQRGSVIFASASLTATATLPTPVDTSKSYIVSYQPVSGQTVGIQYLTRIDFTTLGTSVNSITFTRVGPASSTPTVYFQVITQDNIKVQHFNNISFLSTDLTISQALTPLAATNKAFAISYGNANVGTNTNSHAGFFRANITSTTNVNLVRGGTAGATGSVSLEVIEFTDGTTVEHQSITATSTSNTVTTANTIDPTKHFVFHTFSSNGGALDMFPQIYLSGTNTLNCNRGATAGATTVIVEAYVIIPAGCSVEVDTGADLASTTNAITVSNVTDTTLAFTIPSWTNTGTGAAWGSQVGDAQMTSTSNVNVIIFSAGNTTLYSLQTVQLPASFIKTGNFLGFM